MKSLFVLCLLALVALSLAKSPQSRGCIYILGKCQRECEEGTHGYVSNCGKPAIAEATCDNPDPQEGDFICDYSACYCDSPTVRDTASGKCVAREKCPKK